MSEPPNTNNNRTRDFFLDLSDNYDVEETLGDIPKVEPKEGDLWSVNRDSEYRVMPMEILENLLGTSSLSEDELEQERVLEFIKKQSSFTGEHFKKKYPGFPDRFYDLLEEETRLELKPHIDLSNNTYYLEKM